MKLTRIAKLRHRVFRDFAWPNDLHEFARFNVVYGWNGCGKTTLSSLLSLVEKKAVLTEGEVELEFDNASKISGKDFATTQLPQVKVFNRDFISATLQSVGGIAPIYFLGEDSIEKQNEVSKLKNDLAQANTEVMAATSQKSAADSKLDDFCKDKAKVIKELLTTANSQTYNNYDKRRFRQAAEVLDAQSAAAAIVSDEKKKQLHRQKNAQPKPDITKFVAPAIDVSALACEVEALVGRSVVAQTLDELKTSPRLAAWVQAGLSWHSDEHASDTCRFCTQPFQFTRRAALEAHFNDAFTGFQNDLSTLLEKLNWAKKNAGSLSLPDTSRFYEALASEVATASASVTSVRSETEAALDVLITRIMAKRDNPFAPAATAPLLASMPPLLAEAVTALNSVVDKHNRTSREFRASVDQACKELEASYVGEAHAEFVQFSEVVTNASTALEDIKTKPADIQSRIDELERAILEHRRPGDELTKELHAYLGRDELRFEVRGSGYALTRDGQPVSHLSEGERTAIAFLYFLKSLQDKAFDMSKGIVVIDDPVSSLDANSLFSAFGYMKERTKECGQLFILTHNFQFFRNVKNWFHYIIRHSKRLKLGPEPAQFYLLRARHHSDGSRTGQLGPLDPLLREHDSEYQYLFKRVYDEAHRNDVVTLEHHYGLPNVARRLTESFLAFRYPDETGDNKLHRSLERVSFDEAKKTRILRLLNTYSHAGAVSEPEHDLSLLAETQPVLLDILEMMKAIDKEHYEGLEKLVATEGSPT